MLKLSDWSLGRVLLLSAVWLLITLALICWQAYRQFAALQNEAQKSGVFAIAFSIPGVAVLLLGPPLVLVLLWCVTHRVGRSPTP
jgi:hypothetical protein